MTDTHAAELHVIERRIGAVQAVRQVLQSVWGMARAELPIAEAAAAEAAEYARWTDDVIGRLLTETDVPAASMLRVLVGPERAFAGALPRRYEEALAEPGPIGIVGRRLAEVVDERAGVRDRVRFRLPAATSPGEAEESAARIAQALMAHGSEEESVLLVHPGPSGELETSTLLGAGRVLRPAPPETLSPIEDVVDATLRELVTARLAFALVETLRAEVRARLAMAEAARSACDRRLDGLLQAWRAARQERITNEILEVVGARLALEG